MVSLIEGDWGVEDPPSVCCVSASGLDSLFSVSPNDDKLEKLGNLKSVVKEKPVLLLKENVGLSPLLLVDPKENLGVSVVAPKEKVVCSIVDPNEKVVFSAPPNEKVGFSPDPNEKVGFSAEAGLGLAVPAGVAF